MEIEDWLIKVRASSHIERFHNTVTHKNYSVGFHTYNAMTIAYYLLCMNGVDEREGFHLLVYTMMHDAHESYTGDIPANFKWNHPDIMHKLEAIEEDWEKVHLPDNFVHAKSKVFTNRTLTHIFKQADILELGFFIKDEIDMGNKRLEETMHLVLNSSLEKQSVNELRGVYEIINYLRGNANV